jgi:F-type H+/Na+-transporting ATPase subunit alpha
MIFALNNGFLDSIAVDQLAAFEEKFLTSMRLGGKGILDAIKTSREITDDTKKQLQEFIETFKKDFSS